MKNNIEEGCTALVVPFGRLTTVGRFLGKVVNGQIEFKGNRQWEIDFKINYRSDVLGVECKVNHIDEQYLMRIDDPDEEQETEDTDELVHVDSV